MLAASSDLREPHMPNRIVHTNLCTGVALSSSAQHGILMARSSLGTMSQTCSCQRHGQGISQRCESTHEHILRRELRASRRTSGRRSARRLGRRRAYLESRRRRVAPGTTACTLGPRFWQHRTAPGCSFVGDASGHVMKIAQICDKLTSTARGTIRAWFVCVRRRER